MCIRDRAKEVIAIKSFKEGYVKDLEAMTLGLVSMKLGGGRQTTDDAVSYTHLDVYKRQMKFIMMIIISKI